MDPKTATKDGTLKLPWYLFVSARPRQWLKNLALFAALLFSGEFFEGQKFLTVFFGFAIFSLLTSSLYLLNDVLDKEKDKLHPFKKERPIAQGLFSPWLATPIAFLGALLAIYLGYQLHPFFAATLATYFVLQLIYTFLLKQLMLIDVMAIAAGYILRVYAGAILIDAHVTVWFLLTVVSLSLFLAIGKRRSEFTLLGDETRGAHRKTLIHYPEGLLDSLVAMFSTATWLAYAIFTFLEPTPKVSPTVLILLSGYLPRTFLASKLLMLTVPLVIYGVMRYLYVIYEKKEGDSPEKVLLTDFPLLSVVILWGFLVLFILYWIGTGLEI